MRPLAVDLIDKWLGRYQYALGKRYRSQGQLVKAITAFDAAEKWLVTNRGAKHPHVVAAIISRAATYAQMGRTIEACRDYERALDLITATVGRDHPKAAEVTRYLDATCR